MKVIKDGKTDDLICNLCGETLKQIISTDGMYNFCGLEEVDMVCGYGSLNDGLVFTFSLCEKCVEDLISKFKIPAQVKDYLNPGDPLFDLELSHKFGLSWLFEFDLEKKKESK